MLQTRTVEAQKNQQPGTPSTQQPTPQQSGQVTSPFPLIEEAQIKEFDALPKEEQKARLAASGPLFPQKFSMSNLSLRAFVKGNAPLVIDYALQPNSTAVLTLSAEGVEPFTVVLTQPETPQDAELNRRLGEILQPGATAEQRGGALIRAILEGIFRNWDRARNHLTVQLPASFGETPQVGKLSIQAFTNGPGERKPAYFRLYGLGMGSKAVSSRASIDRPGTAMANHSHSHGFAMPEGEGSLAIDQIILSTRRINTGRRQKVKYRIHSLSGFNGVKIIFYRMEEIENVSFTVAAHVKDLGPITENGWLKPTRCSCEWDGLDGGAASLGTHNVEVRAWLGLFGDWASAWSDPQRVRID